MSDSRFFWFDLLTSDIPSAKAFYGALVGWKTQEMMGGFYNVIESDGRGLGGIVSNAPHAPGAWTVPPMWMGYVHVADVDASTARAVKLGATVKGEPTDIPNTGRFSVITDPQGASIALFKPTPPPGQTHNPAMRETKGHFSWAELYTSDWEKAWTFYGELFGWQRTDTLDMGPKGKYGMFTFGKGEPPMGGMMNVPGRAPYWNFYVTVDDCDTAVKQIPELGGKVLSGPHDVPGGGRVAQCVDPQGAAFGVFSRKG